MNLSRLRIWALKALSFERGDTAVLSDENAAKHLKIENITLRYQARVLEIVSLVLIPIYGIRCIVAQASGKPQIAALFGMGILLIMISRLLPRFTKEYRHLGFASSVLLISIESLTSFHGNEHYALPAVLITLAITYCSFMSGLLYGSLVACISLLEVFLLLRFGMSPDPTGATDQVNAFFLRLVIAELLLALVLFVFQSVLDQGENDITIHRDLREKTARRAALAEVLGKLAHEVNNPLAILQASFQRYHDAQGKMSLEARHQLLGYMDEGQKRLQNVLESLRLFKAGDLPEPMQPIRVQELIQVLARANFERIRSSGNSFHYEPVDSQALVFGRPEHILFILSVLLDNALDAMQDKPGTAILRFVAKPKVHRFEIEDTGIGISDNVSERIFQPFVTTKPFGRSMGMNLSICHGLAAEQSGQLGFHRKATGTIFWLELPKADLTQRA